MTEESYIIFGIMLGLLFTELTGLSPGGIIVPGYFALFLGRPLEIALTTAAAAGVMFAVKFISRLFFLFGRRRYVLCLLLGMLCKLGIERVYQGFASDSGSAAGIIGWLIPGIIANDMYKQGIPRTVLAAATVTALVFLLAQVRRGM
jgi:poly-gamma-glutamate biosynthesis protein PgsC/CapC